MATDLLEKSVCANFDAILGARVEISDMKPVLRLELSRTISPEWLKRLTASLLTGPTVIHCLLEWIDMDGTLVTASLVRPDGTRPQIASQGPFIEVDHVVLVWGSSALTKENGTSLNAFRLRDTCPDSRR